MNDESEKEREEKDVYSIVMHINGNKKRVEREREKEVRTLADVYFNKRELVAVVAAVAAVAHLGDVLAVRVDYGVTQIIELPEQLTATVRLLLLD